ncbi:hypothetical protein [Methanoregula sp.]|uniref:hypothetical protein n=1 Tax=Methanoregula sp. TaxID=2052170 RepID=UPI003C1AF72B
MKIPGFTPKLLTGACIAGPVLGLILYAVLRISDGWRYTPVVFAAVFLLGVGSFSVWAGYYGRE